MKAMAWALAVVLVAGLLVAEVAMQLTSPERSKLYQVFGATSLLTFIIAAAVLGLAPRLRSLRVSLQLVAFAAVAVTGVSVAGAAVTMMIEPHDLKLVLVALLLGVGLGGVVAAAIASPLTKDLTAISTASRAVGEGHLSARTGVMRGDELGTAAEAFDQMAHKLETSEQQRQHLLSAISHDLRTPLASMQAAVEALQDGLAPDPTAYLRGISLDLDHLRTLVDDLFLMSYIESGSYQLTISEIDLAELADEAVEAVAPAAARHGVKVRVDAPGRVRLAADPTALGRVFRNLLANAVRHSPAGGEVRIELNTREARVEALVIDQGNGFAPEMRRIAFDHFVRADDSRNRHSGGTGLGLSIAKGLIEAHGGVIEIVDGPGGRIRFALPVGSV